MKRNNRKEWLTRRWDAERGIWMMDYNNCLVLLRASVEDVCQALRDKTSRWERDVLGGDILLGQDGLFVFRLRGHSWAEVLHNSYGTWFSWFTNRSAKLLSRRLRTRAILYCVSDTCGSTGYELFESGRLLEEFEATGGQCKFRSEVRKVDPEETRNIWGFAHQFFVGQDAFDPFIQFSYFLGHQEAQPGDRQIVQNPGHALYGVGVSRPGLERVDYLELRRPAPARGRRS